MALNIAIFETISPSRFISFTIPNPSSLYSLLRVAVLDSPIQSTHSPRVASLFVPNNRQDDWIFSTESGHLQLLLSYPGISRLILIGNNPISGSDFLPNYRKDHILDAAHLAKLEVSSKPLLIALSPKLCVLNGASDVQIVLYEDNLISSVVIETCHGVFVGDMLVEDVEIESEIDKCKEFRRRLRFKRLPNLVQTEICMVPVNDCGLEFKPDFEVLEPPYLRAMVASLSLISSNLEKSVKSKVKPKALCVGVGGGVLLGFLKTQFGFDVVGIEIDEEVLMVARQYFGLEEENDSIKIVVGDAIEWMEKYVDEHSMQNHTNNVDADFDVVMVDLDSSSAVNGISAPPLEFVTKNVLLAAKSLLSDFGIFVVNVIPCDRLSYDTLIHELRDIFVELYEIDVENGDNFVLIGSVSALSSLIKEDCHNMFLEKLRLVIPEAYGDLITEI